MELYIYYLYLNDASSCQIGVSLCLQFYTFAKIFSAGTDVRKFFLGNVFCIPEYFPHISISISIYGRKKSRQSFLAVNVFALYRITCFV